MRAQSKSTKKEYGLGWIYKKTKGTRLSLVFYTILILAGVVTELSTAFFLKLFVDIATGDSNLSLLLVAGLAVAVMGIGGLLSMIGAVISKNIYGKMERGLRAEMMDIIFTRNYLDISRQHTGELLTKLTTDIQAVSTCFTSILSNMVGGAASALFATAALFFLNWKLAIIMLILMPFLMLVMGMLTPHIEKASLDDKKNDEQNRSMIQENLSRIMLIKAYFMKNKVIDNMNNVYEKKLKSGMKLGMWEGIAAFSGSLVSYALFMTALGIGAYFVIKGETTFGVLIAIIQLLNYIVMPVGKFSSTVSQVSQAVASSGRIGSLYDIPAEIMITAAQPVDALSLMIENLSFSYSHENDNVDNIFDDVNALFARGQITGIIGKSGSGKSTLIKILIGLYTTRQGTVTLKHTNGVLYGEDILPQVAYVPPVDYLFSGTILDNIIMSETEPRLEEMKAAVSSANIIDYIQSLPQGFDTAMGESGGTVSSGQAQRLAIARAIYKKSPIVVFDEPTANLDVDSIEKFQSAVRLLAKDKICIIVTHDISTITVCDKIYVLDEGHIREMHRDEELDANVR